MLHSKALRAVRLSLLVFSTGLVLTDHCANKWTDLAVNGVAPQYTARGQVIEIRMPLHLFQRRQLCFAQSGAGTTMGAVAFRRDRGKASQVTSFAGRKNR